jgi:hypothetical protein
MPPPKYLVCRIDPELYILFIRKIMKGLFKRVRKPLNSFAHHARQNLGR